MMVPTTNECINLIHIGIKSCTFTTNFFETKFVIIFSPHSRELFRHFWCHVKGIITDFLFLLFYFSDPGSSISSVRFINPGCSLFLFIVFTFECLKHPVLFLLISGRTIVLHIDTFTWLNRLIKFTLSLCSGIIIINMTSS